MALEMQKLVIDTNVIISALIGKGNPYRILYHVVFDEKARLHFSEEIWEEYVEVLNRERFAKFPDFKTNAEIVLNRLAELGKIVVPTKKIEMLKDTDDNMFLETAVAANADFLITGNTNDFTISQIEKTKIVTPADYWENYRPAQ